MDSNVVINKNIYKTFAKYVSLNMLSMFAFSFYILADTFFIANAVGNNGLVALNLVLPVFSLLNGAGALLGIGGSTIYSIARGAGDENRKRRIFTQIFIIGCVVGGLITIICMSLSSQIVRLLGADSEVFALAKSYFLSLMAFSLFFIINHIMMAFIKNDGAPKLAMIAMLASSAFNVLFDYILMYPCKLGMIGASIATGISPILSLLILSSHFIRKKNSFKLIKTKFYIKDVRQCCGAGISSLVTEMSNGVTIFVFNLVIIKIAGNVGVGAYGVIANLALVGAAIFNGLGQGIQPIVSANYGAGKLDRVRKTWLLTLFTTLIVGGIFYLTTYLFRYQLISLFNRDKIPELTALAQRGMTLYNVAFFATGITVAGSYFLACISRAQYATLVSLLRGILLPTPLVLLLPLALKIDGVWSSIPIAEAIAAITTCIIIFATLYKLKLRKQKESLYEQHS